MSTSHDLKLEITTDDGKPFYYTRRNKNFDHYGSLCDFSGKRDSSTLECKDIIYNKDLKFFIVSMSKYDIWVNPSVVVRFYVETDISSEMQSNLPQAETVEKEGE